MKRKRQFDSLDQQKNLYSESNNWLFEDFSLLLLQGHCGFQ